jgi:peroxiredoxin
MSDKRFQSDAWSFLQSIVPERVGGSTAEFQFHRALRRKRKRKHPLLWNMIERPWFRTFAAVALTSLFITCQGGLRAQEKQPPSTSQEQEIVAQLKGLRKVPDEKRGEVTKELALKIRKLPADAAKIGLANGLANLSTEGDFGHDPLQEVATTLADALREQPDQSEQPYSELGQLIRYEHVTIALDAPQLKTAMAKLETDDRDRQNADFTLPDLTGKAWTLKSLAGHVVLVNFWATWCPPCRKEMPDLDALYKRFKDQGLIILAISDENADKVTPFLAAHGVSYPILLDPGRKVNEEFHVEGIPKSFVYDRAGNLVAQSIDMRTQAQFLAMLSKAGLQ